MSVGKLYFYHGCMNTGKTAKIMMDTYSLKEKGESVYIIKKTTDTRTTGTIKSRAIQKEVKCDVFDSYEALDELLNNIEKDLFDIEISNETFSTSAQTNTYVEIKGKKRKGVE